MFDPKSRIDTRQVIVGKPATHVRPMPEEKFFEWRATMCNRNGVMPDPGDRVPLPSNVPYWYTGSISGTEGLVYLDKKHLYALMETEKTGYCLFHWEYTGDERYYTSARLFVRPIIERRVYIMGMNGRLAQMVDQTARAARMGFDVSNSESAQAASADAPTGMTGGVNPMVLSKFAMTHGYVFGYVMGNAPQITMSVSRKKKNDGTVDSTIIAKQSRPSRFLSVLMALPAKCVMRNGVLASPQDIQQCNVEWNRGDAEMIYTAMPKDAAISYIFALGGALPDYAPNVEEDRKTQWDAAAILNESPEVSFVQARAALSSAESAENKFLYRLKPVNGRRSLFTKHNHVCLRAVVHQEIPDGVLTPEQAYELNESAFGHLRYRETRTKDTDCLTRAIADCPSMLCLKDYDINGTIKKGIGSCFFMTDDTEETPSGTPMIRQTVEYYPWHLSGDKKPPAAYPCKQIVKRVPTTTKAGNERLVPVALTYKENRQAAEFAEYAPFVDAAIKKGFITQERLENLGGRSARTSRLKLSMDEDTRAALSSFIMSDKVMSEVDDVMNRVANEMMLNKK